MQAIPGEADPSPHLPMNFPASLWRRGLLNKILSALAAGLAKCGKKAYAVSPACFLSTRSYEQCKIDVAYSDTNVKLIGISGGR